MYIFYMITNQLILHTEALGDVQAYVGYVERVPTSFKSIIYRQVFEQIKSPM